jgi:hypothetical protein
MRPTLVSVVVFLHLITSYSSGRATRDCTEQWMAESRAYECATASTAYSTDSGGLPSRGAVGTTGERPDTGARCAAEQERASGPKEQRCNEKQSRRKIGQFPSHAY